MENTSNPDPGVMMMGFGENNNGFGSMMMMMMPHPPLTAGSQPHNTAPFLPTNYHQTLNSSMILDPQHTNYSSNNMSNGVYFMEDGGNEDDGSCSARAKIMAHPHYHRLVAAYVNCQKIGAPPEVVAKLEHACASAAADVGIHGGRVGDDPALDQFMEAYCEMLNKYEQELTKPFKEASVFLSRIECQLNALNLGGGVEEVDRNLSSEGEFDVHASSVDPEAEDRELKGQLLRRYSGYLGSLKQEFMKKRKKGKLPKEARHQLLEWWSRHYKWPYPSESQKLALAEATGLDQKQINNWFINQRKRHWKPSEDMQFVVMDAAHPYYMGNPFPMDL